MPGDLKRHARGMSLVTMVSYVWLGPRGVKRYEPAQRATTTSRTKMINMPPMMSVGLM